MRTFNIDSTNNLIHRRPLSVIYRDFSAVIALFFSVRADWHRLYNADHWALVPRLVLLRDIVTRWERKFLYKFENVCHHIYQFLRLDVNPSSQWSGDRMSS